MLFILEALLDDILKNLTFYQCWADTFKVRFSFHVTDFWPPKQLPVNFLQSPACYVSHKLPLKL